MNEIDTAKYRWKIEASKEVLVPEGEYESDSPYDWLNTTIYRIEIPTTLTNDDFIKMVEDGAVATVNFIGEEYTCTAYRLSGDMDDAFGFGNPFLMAHYADNWDAEDNGEPFAIYYNWYESCIEVTSTQDYLPTFSAHIDGEPTLVSIGKNDNPLTVLEGGIVNGVFNNARYKLATPFKLLHNKDWAVEWKSIGACDNDAGMAKIWDETGQQTSSTSRCILFRHTSKSITFSRYSDTHHHCGVRLAQYGYDYGAEHIYRLQNKVNDDGTNMVYLYVDDVEVAPMRDTFSNKGDEGLTDWIVGKDFSMGYMGTPRYFMNGFIMDDIAVWESGADEEFGPKTVDYTISYQTAHGTPPASKTITVNEGESYALTEADLPALSADGYIFGGWSVNGVVVSVGYEISADTVLVAVWVEDLPVSQIDPTSMLIGWLVGRRIVSRRK